MFEKQWFNGTLKLSGAAVDPGKNFNWSLKIARKSRVSTYKNAESSMSDAMGQIPIDAT